MLVRAGALHAVWLLVVIIASACASSRLVDDSLPTEATLPTEAVLAEIARRPQPTPSELFAHKFAEADAWTLHGPGATQTDAGAYQGDDPEVRAFVAALARGPQDRRVTAGMQCFAEELGRFWLLHGAEPALDIQSFMASRCGTLVVSPQVSVWSGEEGSRLTDHREALEKMSDVLPPRAHVGMWRSHGEGERVIAVLAFGVPEVELQPVPLDSGGHGWVELRGRVAWGFDALVGRASKDPLGHGMCEPVPGVATAAWRGSEFALRCSVSPNDEMAVIELYATPRGRLLGRSVLRLIVSPLGVVPNAYRAPSLSLPVSPGEHEEVAMVTAINALRHGAGLRPVSVAQGQTEVVESLLPHLLAAMDDPRQAELANQISLGLIAGWRVRGDVRSGTFIVTASAHGWSLERELAAQLFSPVVRSQLFDPATATVSYAQLADRALGMRRAVVASYRLFEDRDYTAEIAAFLDAVDRQRAVLGLEPVLRFQGEADRAPLLRVARRLRGGEVDLDDALDELLKDVARYATNSAHAMILQPPELDGWSPELEGDLVTAPGVAVTVVMSHFSPRGSAWGRQLVLVVFTVQ